MWHEAFGLKTRPFRNRPVGQPLFPPEGRGRALARLARPLRDREGWAALVGPPGVGKTVLLHHLASDLGRHFQVSWLGQTQLPDLAALHQTLLFDWNESLTGKGEQDLRLAVIGRLIDQARTGQATLLVVDDAHHLTHRQLEELRLLGNLESGEGKCLVGVIAGQPGLRSTLSATPLASFAQECGVRVEVQPFSPEEAAEFIRSQLLWAGRDPANLIDPEAVALLARGARGIPRLLNQFAAAAFQVAADAEQRRVDVECVLAAAEELDLCLDDDEQPDEPRWSAAA